MAGRIVSVHGELHRKISRLKILAAKNAGDSVGGIAEITATGGPAGSATGFGKSDALIAGAMMGIGAVKGVEVGDGFAVAGRFGSENNDPIRKDGFLSNHAGGILGGISSGAGDRGPHRSKTHAVHCKAAADHRHPWQRCRDPVSGAGTIPASSPVLSRWPRRCWRWCSPMRCWNREILIVRD